MGIKTARYAVYWGSTVPFRKSTYGSWKETATAIKHLLDTGIEVHSVHKLTCSEEDI